MHIVLSRVVFTVLISVGVIAACGDSASDSPAGGAGSGGSAGGSGTAGTSGSAGTGGSSGSAGAGGTSGSAGAGGSDAAVDASGGAAGSASDGSTPNDAGAPRWPGHQVGKILLGMSTPAADWNAKLAELKPQAPGVRRKFYEWNEAAAEDTQIAADHAAHRIPWISFKPPVLTGTVPARWAAVTAGGYDADIRARAQRYAKLSRPVIVTFHHEPSNDASEADGVKWANAWIHIYDVMKAETGLKNTAFAPIIGDWLFNAKNSQQDPANWVKPGVISRQPFLGIDLYQNDSGEGFSARLDDILKWLASQGDPNAMVGVGEVGSTDFFAKSDPKAPSAVKWWNDSWQWASTHTDRIGVISYFNSTRNSKPDHVWDLGESPAKLTAFKAALASPVATSLP
ncbi:MAG: hypothetical protein IPI67_09805 [Myxococcales bacterium]|nr:hypothetical protein [Myxococcales bacterium]